MGETTKASAHKYRNGGVSVHVETSRHRVEVRFSGMTVNDEVIMLDRDKRALSPEEAAYRNSRIKKMESAQQALFKENERIDQRDNAVVAAMKF